MIRFEIDPTLVTDALTQGKKLVVEVRQDHQGRVFKTVTLGDASPYRQPIARSMRA